MKEIEDILDRFMKHSADDPGIGPSHISLFIAILVLYAENGKKLPIAAFSRQLRAVGKMSSRTYYECIRYLNSKRYIVYEPSYDPEKASLIYFTQDKKT